MLCDLWRCVVCISQVRYDEQGGSCCDQLIALRKPAWILLQELLLAGVNTENQNHDQQWPAAPGHAAGLRPQDGQLPQTAERPPMPHPTPSKTDTAHAFGLESEQSGLQDFQDAAGHGVTSLRPLRRRQRRVNLDAMRRTTAAASCVVAGMSSAGRPLPFALGGCAASDAAAWLSALRCASAACCVADGDRNAGGSAAPPRPVASGHCRASEPPGDCPPADESLPSAPAQRVRLADRASPRGGALSGRPPPPLPLRRLPMAGAWGRRGG